MDIEVKDSAINSFLIEGFPKNIPLIDIFTLLSKQVNDINKITFFHEPMNYVSNNCKYQVDFANHESLVKAKLILNAQNLNNLFESKGQKIKISECLLNKSNLVNETVSKTKALMFENMQINQINIHEFIMQLNHFIYSNSSGKDKKLYKISKIRQYSNRILVIFEPNIPECLKKFIRKGENESNPTIPYFNYKNKNIPIIPKMKPIVNVGKYKEKNIKLSVHNLNEEDKNNLHSIFEKKDGSNDDNLMLSKMADIAMNNLNKEKIIREDKLKKTSLNKKRERIREKSGEKEKDRRDRDRDRDRDREPMNRDKMRDSNRNRDMKSNRIRDRDNRREKNRDYNNSRNVFDERREDSSSDRDRKRDNINLNMNNNNNINNYRNNNGNSIPNINNNSNTNINSNLNGLNINENDLNQVASLFSNAKAVNLVKLLLESNAFNNINPKTNLNQNINNSNNNNIGNINPMNNNNIIQNKPQMKLNEEPNNNNKNLNYNEALNNLYNQNQNNMNNNANFQQLLNLLQSQNQNNLMNTNNKNNQTKQRMNNNNNISNNFQNLLNMNQLMGMDNSNLANNNYFNNQRQFQYPLNEQFMNQFNAFSSPQKRKNNDN